MSGRELLVSVDGAIVDREAARVSALDTTFTQGLGAFDTLLVEGGAARFRERHLERLRGTCTYLGLDSAEIERMGGWLDEYVAVLPTEPLAVRTTVTRGTDGAGGKIVIAARRFDAPPSGGVTLAVEGRFALAGDDLDRHKTTNRARHVLARESAVRDGSFDALLLHRDGDVADATSANVWVRVDGELVTPPIARGALPGIVRAVLVEEFARAGEIVMERPLGYADLVRAEEIFLTNSLHRAVGVSAVRGLVEGLPGSGGDVTQRAFGLVIAAERRYV